VQSVVSVFWLLLFAVAFCGGFLPLRERDQPAVNTGARRCMVVCSSSYTS
jgi:hypothetical protein